MSLSRRLPPPVSFGQIRGNEHELRIITNHLPVGYGRGLGDVLSLQSRVSLFQIRLDTLLSPNETMEHHPLIRYLSCASSLCQVQLLIGDPPHPAYDETNAMILCRAIAENQHIQELSGFMEHVPPRGLADILQQTRSIHTLELSTVYASSSLMNDGHLVYQALSANQTIRKVSLTSFSERNGNADVILNSLLMALARHSHLQHLNVTEHATTTPPSLITGLVTLLHSTRTLSQLDLDGPSLDERVITALHDNRTLTWLRLSRVALTQDLIRLIQTHANRHWNQLSELELVLPRGRPWRPDEVANLLIGSALQGLKLPYTPQVPSRPASSHRFFTLENMLSSPPPHDTSEPGFFDRLAVASKHVGVRRLGMDGLDRESAEGLVRFLAVTDSLRELSLHFLVGDVDVSRLVSGIVRNGSLWHVAFEPIAPGQLPVRHRPATLTEGQLRLVRAVCQRNETLPRLLSEAIRGDGVTLIPALFGVAQQAPHGAVTNLLAGLMNAFPPPE